MTRSHFDTLALTLFVATAACTNNSSGTNVELADGSAGSGGGQGGGPAGGAGGTGGGTGGTGGGAVGSGGTGSGAGGTGGGAGGAAGAAGGGGGGKDAGADATGTGGSSSGDPYYPVKVGNSWTYRVTDSVLKVVTTKSTTLEAEEAVGTSKLFNMANAYAGKNADTLAIRYTTRKGANMADKSVGWINVADRGGGNKAVVTFREQAYTKMGTIVSEEDWWSAAPQKTGDYRLKFDESHAHTSLNAAWEEDFSETKFLSGTLPKTTVQKEQWKVLAVDVPVEIDRGNGKGKWSFMCIKVQKKQTSTGTVKTSYYARGVGKVKEEGGQLEELIDYKLIP